MSKDKRVLTTKEAANYVGCATVNQFWNEVAKGVWPQPLSVRCRPRRWDKQELDRAIDKHNSMCNNRAVPLD